MNSIPQQEVAKGKGHKEFLRAKPTTWSKDVAKKPAPSIPSGALVIFTFDSIISLFSVLIV
jgi:hypothetical protein